MNSLVDRLPPDLFTHLYQYSKFLSDVDVYSLAKSSQTILRLIGSKYELQEVADWFIYRLVDIEALGLKLPWTTNEEKSRYVLDGRSHSQLQSPLASSSSSSCSLDRPITSPTPPDTLRLTSPDEWVILRHPLERLSGWGCTTLPFNSLMTNEYQHSPNMIGVITLLAVSTPRPPRPFISEFSSNQSGGRDAALFIPKWKDGLIKLPHLRFLPKDTLIDLTLTNVCINAMEIIQTYVWPKKLVNLRLHGFNPSLFNESMVPNWPSSLRNLMLYSIDLGAMHVNWQGSRLYFPSALTSLEMDRCEDSISNQILGASLPKSLTSLTWSPKADLNELKLNDLPSLHRLGFYGSKMAVDGWELPPSLLELQLGSAFNQPISGMIFNSSLTRLTLLRSSYSLDGVQLPNSLQAIQVGADFGYKGETLFGVKLPEGLQTLKYGSYIDTCLYQPEFRYPSSLTSLELGDQAGDVFQPNEAIWTEGSQFKLVLPPGLTELRIPLHLLLVTH